MLAGPGLSRNYHSLQHQFIVHDTSQCSSLILVSSQRILATVLKFSHERSDTIAPPRAEKKMHAIVPSPLGLVGRNFPSWLFPTGLLGL